MTGGPGRRGGGDGGGGGGGLERTLDRRYYQSDEIFALEKERIFCAEWFCVGREEELPDPGDFVVKESRGRVCWSCGRRTEGWWRITTSAGIAGRSSSSIASRGPSPAAFAVRITPGPTPSTARYGPPRSSKSRMVSPRVISPFTPLA